MKTSVSSVDVYYLVREISCMVVGGRVDSVFEAGGKTLVFEVFKSGVGRMSLVVAPNFLCVSQYPREKPSEPSSFVMQLRKNLGGCFVRGVSQHAFDRIVEVELDGRDSSFVLVLELFSKGNIILCDKERKIVGLLEWQKWRDRKLGVGLVYEYPPRTVNPITLTGEDISRMLDESQRDLVRTLASCGLPGLYAEEVCARAGADKNASAAGLGALKARVVDSFISLVEEVRGGKSSSKIILGDGNPVDVVPLDLRAHADSHSKPYSSFNEAVDEYFSSAEFDARKKASESEHAREKGKLEKRLSEQEKALERARGEVYEYRRIGDLLFSRKHEIEALVSEIKLQRKKGASDNEILAQLTKTGLVKDLNKTELTLML